MSFIKVSFKGKDNTSIPVLINLDTIEHFAIINKGTPLEYIELVYKEVDKDGDNLFRELTTPMSKIVEQLEELNLITKTKK